MMKTSALVAASAAVAAIIGFTYGITSYLSQQQYTVGGVTAHSPPEQAFKASDFKFPELMQSLNNGESREIVNTDEAVFALYYLKEMNEVFGDPDMKVFIDAKCFTQIYDADMSARLQAVFWTKVLPKGLWEMGSVMADGRPFGEALSRRYPILSGMLKEIAGEVPDGKLDRLFILGNFPSILQARARQDALTLFSTYGCANPVTRRIYANAVKFVKAYRVRFGS